MATIESILHEKHVFPPGDEFVQHANVSGLEAYQALCNEAQQDYPAFWARLARHISIGILHSRAYWMKLTRYSTNGSTMANSMHHRIV
ncbi:MAG: hypothetical protein RI993_790 [Pseudomonadota bacterium]|jgi:hypothetical protein